MTMPPVACYKMLQLCSNASWGLSSVAVSPQRSSNHSTLCLQLAYETMLRKEEALKALNGIGINK